MRQAIRQMASVRNDSWHPGLLLHRFLKDPKDPEERNLLLSAAISSAKNPGLIELYKAAYARWKDSFPDFKDILVETTDRIVVGLGSETVLETGLTLHHTYGVPIIPGSSIKGISSHYCHDVWGHGDDENAPEENMPFQRDGSYHNLIFGTPEERGLFNFHDAWMTPETLSHGALCLDVMSPHHLDYPKKVLFPTDFDEPKPIFFLSVRGTFTIHLEWSGPKNTDDEKKRSWTDLTMKLVLEALEDWGAGGKTRSGYGKLKADDSPEDVSIETPVNQMSTEIPQSGQMVEVVMLEDRTKKNKWRASVVSSQ